MVIIKTILKFYFDILVFFETLSLRYEMGIYDQPAAIDYILHQTRNSQLHYLGFSQGTTSLMVLLSEKPEYNHKIRVASLLAPVGYKSRVDIFFTLLYALPPVLKVNLK